MKAFSILLVSSLVLLLMPLAACTDDKITPTTDGDVVSDGDTDSSDGDLDVSPVDGDGEVIDGDLFEEDVAPHGDVEESDGDEAPDGDADAAEDDGEEDTETCGSVDPADLPRIFPADVTCWAHSSHAVTDSDSTLEIWKETCESADSGNADYRCRAATVVLVDADGAHNAVQCESWHVCDEDPGWPTDVQPAWLGPAYGNIVNDMNIFASRVTGLVTTSAYMYCAGTYPGWPPDAAVPAWTPERIDDALAHDVSAVACEQITDYRQCVRAFIPPNSHCVPNFSYPENVDAISETCDWENDPLFYTADFVGCTTFTEPFNWPL
jgi:hypothetical protein